MGMDNFNTDAVLASIRAIDNRYPGSMKLAGIVTLLSELVSINSPSPFDPDSIYSIVKAVDEEMPGSMKLAAMVYLLAQISAGSLVVDSGIVQLSGGSATVSSPSASASNTILLSYYSLDGNTATLRYSSIVSGKSFQITSSNSGDTNKVSWAIVNP